MNDARQVREKEPRLQEAPPKVLDDDARMTRSTPRRIAVAFLAAVLVAGNVAVMTGPSSTLEMRPRIPLIEPLLDIFLIFGVFSWYETTNQEMTVWGLTRGSESQPSYWRYLPSEQYFAGCFGERQSRLWASRHYRTLSTERHWEGWGFLGRKILRWHNRLRPDDPIVRVAFQNEHWPRSIEGFYARRGPSPERQVWVVTE